MEENFIGYLLDALDDRARRQVEAHLAQHPEACEKLALLKQAPEPLAADSDAESPPAYLAERTLAKVAAHVCDKDRPADILPQAPPVSPSTWASHRSWWRRVDVVVAACLLVTVTGIGLIVIGRMRGPDSGALLTECKNNLRQFYVALQSYQDQRGSFPNMDKESPRNVAGMVVPMLKDAGVLPPTASIRCPGNGTAVTCQFSVAALREMNNDEFAQNSPCLSMCYAYSLGHWDDGGGYHGPGDVAKGSFSQTPIMADRPPAEGVVQNSLNHGGVGQNVLFADGHVQFMPQRTFGPNDDIFLNRLSKVAAGVDAADIVLGCSAARPK